MQIFVAGLPKHGNGVDVALKAKAQPPIVRRPPVLTRITLAAANPADAKDVLETDAETPVGIVKPASTDGAKNKREPVMINTPLPCSVKPDDPT